MRKIIYNERAVTTVWMEKQMYDLLFSEANERTKEEGKIISVPEIIRRIIWLHYAKKRVKSKKAR